LEPEEHNIETYRHKFTKDNQQHPKDADIRYTKTEHQTSKNKNKMLGKSIQSTKAKELNPDKPEIG
jgi:hypothetical protein